MWFEFAFCTLAICDFLASWANAGGGQATLPRCAAPVDRCLSRNDRGGSARSKIYAQRLHFQHFNRHPVSTTEHVAIRRGAARRVGHPTISQDKEPLTPRTAKNRPPPPPLGIKTRRTGHVVLSWSWELVSLASASGTVVATVAILGRYHGQELPQWPYSINLNTLVAILSVL